MKKYDKLLDAITVIKNDCPPNVCSSFKSGYIVGVSAAESIVEAFIRKHGGEDEA